MNAMTQFFNLTTPAKRFRFIAVVEALTWAALLVGMFFKWVLGYDEAVAIPGMVHGIAFMVYLVVTLWSAIQLKWSPIVVLLALVASLPPLATLVFEWWARKNGHLAELSTPAAREQAAVR